jgi:hypothetical protein
MAQLRSNYICGVAGLMGFTRWPEHAVEYIPAMHSCSSCVCLLYMLLGLLLLLLLGLGKLHQQLFMMHCHRTGLCF